jgi:peptide/nickel transport system substrate-binding protein
MSEKRRERSTYRPRLGRRQILRAGGAAVLALGTVRCAAPPGNGSAAPGGAAVASAGPVSASVSPVPAAAAPKLGGVLRVGVSSAETHLDFQAPGGSSGGWSHAIAYSGLLKFKHGPDVKPPAWIPTGDVAESWEQLDDLTYVFKLRKGVRFNNKRPVNGRELVAEDIIFSFQRQIDLKVNAAPLVNVSKMTAPDHYTLRVSLDRPNADFLVNLADDTNKILAHEVIDENGDLKEGPVIGSGPWILDSNQIGQSANLVKNPDYFVKGLPYLDRFEFIYQATARNIAAVQTDATSICGVALLAPDVDATLKSAPQLKVYSLLDTRNGHEFGFNTARPPSQDVRVRQAVLKSIDLQSILDTVLLGRGELTTGIVLPDESWKLPKDEIQRLFKRDVEGAKALLRDAGMAQGFEAECIFIPVYLSGIFQTEAELMQQQLKEVGITLNLKPLDPAVFTGLTQRGDFQMYVNTQLGQSSANGDLLGRYRSKGPTNYTQFSDPKLDALIDQQAIMSRDPEGRRKVFQDIQRYVVDRAFKIGIAATLVGMPYQPYVKNWWPPQHSAKGSDHWTDIWVDR